MRVQANIGSSAPAGSSDASHCGVGGYAPRPVEVAVSNAADTVRTLSTGEILFNEGDAKAKLYQILSGSIYCQYADNSQEVGSYVFAGDVLGLGFLERHIYSARAIVDTTVRVRPLSALDDLVECDHRAKERYAQEVQTEFAHRKNLITSNPPKSIGRLAAYLLVMSRMNLVEGRDPTIVASSVRCGVVAEWLGLDLQSLNRALVQLEMIGFIEPNPPLGLRLKYPAGLEALADGTSRGFAEQGHRRKSSPGSFGTQLAC